MASARRFPDDVLIFRFASVWSTGKEGVFEFKGNWIRFVSQPAYRAAGRVSVFLRQRGRISAGCEQRRGGQVRKCCGWLYLLLAEYPCWRIACAFGLVKPVQ
jgi:hypothetical protein